MTEIASLHPERLMEHMRALCQEIGPRPPCSPQERQAADYVKAQLARLRVTQVEEQAFKSIERIGDLTVPYILAGVASVPLAALGGRLGKLIGGLVTLLVGRELRSHTAAIRPLLHDVLAKGTSQNVIARIPPTGVPKRRVYLVAHLDSNQQLFLTPTTPTGLTKPFMTASLAGAFLAGLALLISAFIKKGRLPGWLWLLWGTFVGSLGMTINDHNQPHVEGANDNATAVSVVLGIAEALKAHPLEQTEVILLFTGCEEVGCIGMDSYLKRYAPPRYKSYFIDLEMVGTGNICYVTKHGVSKFGEYRPSEELLRIAAKAAIRHPGLNVGGRDMLIVEEVSPLVAQGYNALCIAGYNQEGYLPNWHRLSDTLEHIEPGTLGRAARYTWAVMQEIDHLRD